MLQERDDEASPEEDDEKQGDGEEDLEGPLNLGPGPPHDYEREESRAIGCEHEHHVHVQQGVQVVTDEDEHRGQDQLGEMGINCQENK